MDGKKQYIRNKKSTRGKLHKEQNGHKKKARRKSSRHTNLIVHCGNC
jgi:hypothetical protein